MRTSLFTLSLLSVALAGCSLVPDYQRPELPVSQEWLATGYPGQASQALTADDLNWRQFFQAPELQGLISTALENNRDLRVAALNVEAYRAQYRIQRSQLFPEAGVSGSGSRQRLPGDLSQTGQAAISSQYSVNLGVSAWELDLFGRLRSLRDQALEQYFASEEAQRAAQVSLVASVANAWLTLQADENLLQLTQDTLKTYEQSYDLTKSSFDVGVASALELSQARTAVDSARVNLAQYRRQVALDRNALALLLGGNLPQTRGVASLDQPVLSQVPSGLPSDLLQTRPDIRQAERSLRAANASIGAARAAFFPSISLTATAGTASSELSGLFDSGSGSWLFQPQINLPIFTAGRLKANLNYAELQKDIQVAQYEKAIQTAFQEVSDGLASRRTYEEQLQAQRELLQTTENYYDLAERRYRGGVDSYLTLLDAQRQLFSVRQQLISIQLQQLVSEVDLFKALGGGWQLETQDEATRS